MAEVTATTKPRDPVFVVTKFFWDYKPGHCSGDTLGVFRRWSDAYDCVIKTLKESIREYLEDDDESVELPTPNTLDELSVFLQHPRQFVKPKPSETPSSIAADPTSDDGGTIWTFDKNNALEFWTYNDYLYQIHKIEVTEAVEPGNKRQRQ